MQKNKNKLLADFLEYQNLGVAKEPEVIIEKEEWMNRYKISLDGHTYRCKIDFFNKFWSLLEQLEYAQVLDFLEDPTKEELSYVPHIPINLVDGSFDESTLTTALGVNFINVDNRLHKLVTATSSTIKEIAAIINAEMDRVAKDTTIIKDCDAILTFDTELGENFEVHLCMDKISPIDEKNSGLVINRTKLTKADEQLYLSESKDKLKSRLDHVNQLVKDFILSKDVNYDDTVKKYAMNALDITIAKAFLDQKVYFITFGGLDNWSLKSEDTENNKVCSAIIDDEVNHLIAMLDNLPKEGDITIHSLDIDTFTVFGRNSDNRVLTEPLPEITSKILNRYSKGFEFVLTQRLSQLSNNHFFRA